MHFSLSQGFLYKKCAANATNQKSGKVTICDQDCLHRQIELNDVLRRHVLKYKLKYKRFVYCRYIRKARSNISREGPSSNVNAFEIELHLFDFS